MQGQQNSSQTPLAGQWIHVSECKKKARPVAENQSAPHKQVDQGLAPTRFFGGFLIRRFHFLSPRVQVEKILPLSPRTS